MNLIYLVFFILKSVLVGITFLDGEWLEECSVNNYDSRAPSGCHQTWLRKFAVFFLLNAAVASKLLLSLVVRLVINSHLNMVEIMRLFIPLTGQFINIHILFQLLFFILIWFWGAAPAVFRRKTIIIFVAAILQRLQHLVRYLQTTLNLLHFSQLCYFNYNPSGALIRKC